MSDSRTSVLTYNTEQKEELYCVLNNTYHMMHPDVPSDEEVVICGIFLF